MPTGDLPTICQELLRVLKEDIPTKISELPKRLRDRDVLNVCYEAGVIDRLYCINTNWYAAGSWKNVTHVDLSRNGAAWQRRDRLSSKSRAETSAPTPPAADEITLTEAANRWDIPKSAWTKAAQKKPNEAGYLATRRVGRTVLVRVAVAKHFAENYDARREQRQVGSKSEEGKAIVSAPRSMKKTSGGKNRRKARFSNN